MISLLFFADKQTMNFPAFNRTFTCIIVGLDREICFLFLYTKRASRVNSLWSLQCVAFLDRRSSLDILLDILLAKRHTPLKCIRQIERRVRILNFKKSLIKNVLLFDISFLVSFLVSHLISYLVSSFCILGGFYSDSFSGKAFRSALPVIDQTNQLN